MMVRKKICTKRRYKEAMKCIRDSSHTEQEPKRETEQDRQNKKDRGPEPETN